MTRAVALAAALTAAAAVADAAELNRRVATLPLFCGPVAVVENYFGRALGWRIEWIGTLPTGGRLTRWADARGRSWALVAERVIENEIDTACVLAGGHGQVRVQRLGGRE